MSLSSSKHKADCCAQIGFECRIHGLQHVATHCQLLTGLNSLVGCKKFSCNFCCGFSCSSDQDFGHLGSDWLGILRSIRMLIEIWFLMIPAFPPWFLGIFWGQSSESLPHVAPGTPVQRCVAPARKMCPFVVHGKTWKMIFRCHQTGLGNPHNNNTWEDHRSKWSIFRCHMLPCLITRGQIKMTCSKM